MNRKGKPKVLRRSWYEDELIDQLSRQYTSLHLIITARNLVLVICSTRKMRPMPKVKKPIKLVPSWLSNTDEHTTHTRENGCAGYAGIV